MLSSGQRQGEDEVETPSFRNERLSDRTCGVPFDGRRDRDPFQIAGCGRCIVDPREQRRGAGCYSSMHGESRRRRYDDSSMLPDDFLKECLRALGESTFSQTSTATVVASPVDREREAARYLWMREEHRRERHEDSWRPPNQFADARLQASGGSPLSLCL